MRKNKWILLGVVALIMMFSAGRGFSEDIRLTEDVVQRYIATFPEYWKLTKETEAASKIRNEEEQKKKIDALDIKKKTLMENNKWTDIFEYINTGSRILKVNIFLNVKKIFAKLKDKRKPKAMAELKKWQEENGYLPEEMDAVLKYNAKINKMYVKAGLRK